MEIGPVVAQPFAGRMGRVISQRVRGIAEHIATLAKTSSCSIALRIILYLIL
jgi:hypothetical protein